MKLEEMSFKCFSTFSSVCHFVQPSETILAILVEGHRRNTSVQYFEIGPLVKDEISFEDFLHVFVALAAIFVKWSRTTVTILEFQSTKF